jgi:flagellar hook-basal body complex protein FliE
MPIDPSMAIKGITGGPEWSVGAVDGTATAAPTQGASFGSMLGNQLSALEHGQNAAADASRALADGTASDPAQAVIAVERAQLSMQLASQMRTKGVEALQDIFHTQV